MKNPANDFTPIPAGSWVTVGYSQDLLGALNILTSWRTLATQWAGYLPDTWGQRDLLITDTFARKDAVVQVQVPVTMTVADAYQLLNGISADVSVLAITINGGAPADPSTVTQQAADNHTTLAGLVDDPLGSLEKLLGLLIVLAAIGIGGYFLVSTGTLKKLLHGGKS